MQGSRKRRDSAIDSTLTQLYGKTEVSLVAAPKREEWPTDPKLRVDRITEGFRRKGYKWRTYPMWDTEAPLENDPDKVLKAIRFFLWYCRACRFTVRMALRRFFFSIRTLAALCRQRLERRRRMLFALVTRWTKLQAAAWRKIEDAMASPTYHIRHTTTETYKMKEMLHVSEPEMYMVVKVMYHDQRVRYRNQLSLWFESYEPVHAEIRRLHDIKAIKQKLKQEDEELLFLLRRRGAEMMAMKPHQQSLDMETTLKSFLSRRQQLHNEQTVAQRSDMLERLMKEYRVEMDASRAFYDKLEEKRKREYAARMANIEQNRVAKTQQERLQRTVAAFSSKHHGDSGDHTVADDPMFQSIQRRATLQRGDRSASLSVARELSAGGSLADTAATGGTFDAFLSGALENSSSMPFGADAPFDAPRSGRRDGGSLNGSVQPMLHRLSFGAAATPSDGRHRESTISGLSGRRAVRASIVTIDAAKHFSGRPVYKKPPKDSDPSKEGAGPELIAMWVRRRSSVSTPALPSFIEARQDEPRFHTPLDAEVHLCAAKHQPILAKDVPRPARRGFTSTWRPAATPSSSFLHGPAPLATSVLLPSPSHATGRGGGVGGKRSASAEPTSSTFAGAVTPLPLGNAARPASPLQLRMHDDWIRRRQQKPTAGEQRLSQSPIRRGGGDVVGGAADDAAAKAVEPSKLTLNDVFGRTKPPINISPPVANATHPIEPAPLLKPTRAVVESQYEPPFVVLSRDTIWQLAKSREAAAAQRLQQQVASGSKAHASFACRETEKRVAKAMAATMARIAQMGNL